MKKILLLSFAAIAIVFVSCSDASKAKKMVKNYLEENSNDGKIEIVKCSNLQDYTYEFDEKWLIAIDMESAVREANHQMDMADIYGVGTTEYDIYMAEAEKQLAIADSFQNIIDNTVNKTYSIKKMEISARGNNA